MERVDGTQARLKLACIYKLHRDTFEVERVDGTQARLKLLLFLELSQDLSRGKGGWDSGEIETGLVDESNNHNRKWKGWMGLRRD